MTTHLKGPKVFHPHQKKTCFSHSLGRAIAGACDAKVAGVTGFGMPLGDFEIALDEGAIFLLASKHKRKTPDEERHGEKGVEKPRAKSIRKRVRHGLSEFKDLLGTDWGNPPNDLTDF